MTGSNSTSSTGQPGSNQPPAKKTGTNPSSTSTGQPGPNQYPAKKPGNNTPSTSTGQQGSKKPASKTTGYSTSNNPRPNTASNPAAKSNRATAANAANDSKAAKRPLSSGANDGSQMVPKSFCDGMVTMRLFTREGKFGSAPDNDVKQNPGRVVDGRIKTAMAHCFHLALTLLESSTGHEGLVKVGKKIVERRREKASVKEPEQGLFAGRDLNEMQGCVNDFLRKIRTHGVPVCLTPGIKSVYGQTQRWNWGVDMTKFKPDEAAVVYLNKGMVIGLLESADAVHKFMVQQQENAQCRLKGQPPVHDEAGKTLVDLQIYAQKSFDNAVLLISMTLAHEFVHCFTGYLSGLAAVFTPPGPDGEPIGPYDKSNRGEAGWMWVKETFGGYVNFYYTKGSPELSSSGYFVGTPMIMDLKFEGQDWKPRSMVYTLNHDMVRKIIEMKGWDSEHRADPKWMWKIKNQNDKGTLYTQWLAKNNTVGKIWNSLNGLTDPENGRNLAMACENDIAFAKTLEDQLHISKPLTVSDVRSIKV